MDFHEKCEEPFLGCPNWEDRDKHFAKRIGEKAFLPFKIKKETIFEYH